MKIDGLALIAIVIVVVVLAYLIITMQGTTTIDSDEGTVIDTQEEVDQEVDLAVSDLSEVSDGLKGIEDDLS